MVSPNSAMTTEGRSFAHGRCAEILSPVLSPVTKRLTDDAATSCTLCRVESRSRQRSRRLKTRPEKPARRTRLKSPIFTS
jgi:hypothetical protein